MSVYFIRHGDLIKIGFSSRLYARANAIITSVPGKAEFLGYMPGGREVETHLHDRFSHQRFNGEWFLKSPDLLSLIRIISDPELPVPARPNVKVFRRPTSVDEARGLEEDVRRIAAIRWPLLSVASRTNRIAQELDWNARRVKAFLYRETELRMSEVDELTAWLAMHRHDLIAAK